MTEERKGPGFSFPETGWENVDEVAHLDRIDVKIDPDVKERLDSSLETVRGEAPKEMRGRTRHFVTYDSYGFLPPDAVDEQGYPIGNSREDHAERESKYPDPIEIHATVNINSLDLENDMIAKGAKQIMANELNEMFAQQGIKTHYTPEMLSALAAERLRAEQKRKKKARINKRKRK